MILRLGNIQFIGNPLFSSNGLQRQRYVMANCYGLYGLESPREHILVYSLGFLDRGLTEEGKSTLNLGTTTSRAGISE